VTDLMVLEASGLLIPGKTVVGAWISIDVRVRVRGSGLSRPYRYEWRG
jgi:hypothetical protein